jgi:hypothetical protein
MSVLRLSRSVPGWCLFALWHRLFRGIAGGATYPVRAYIGLNSLNFAIVNFLVQPKYDKYDICSSCARNRCLQFLAFQIIIRPSQLSA